MIQLLIVDDQKEIIQGIQSGIDWMQIPQISRVHHAFSVPEAKRVFSQNAIDLLITDIEMPMENGLSLVAWVNQHYPQVKCIVLTAHAKFQYAQDAVKLHCVDYILQPVQYEVLQESIEKAIGQIIRDKTLNQNSDEAYWNTHREKLLQKTWEDYLSGRNSDSEYLNRQLTEMNIRIPKEDKFGLLIVYRPLQGENIDEWNTQSTNSNISNLLSSYLSAYSDYICLFAQEQTHFSLLFATQLEEKDILDSLHAFSSVDSYSLSFYFRYCRELIHLPEDFQKLQTDFRKILVPKPGVFHRDMLGTEAPGALPSPQNWCSYFENKTTQLITDAISDCIAGNIKKGTMNRATISALQQIFLYAFQESLRKRSLSFADIMADPDVQNAFSRSLLSVTDFQNFATLIIQKNKNLPNAARQPPEDSVELALSFIASHLSDSELSRQDIAKAAHISEGHLSHLFSKRLDISITDYINLERLKLAKALLADTSMSITLIAMKSGFNSTSYFITAFKKFTGSTPTEYRKSTHNLNK